MTNRPRTNLRALPILAAFALALMAAGPSAGDRIAAGQQPSPPVTPDPSVPCQDDSAVLVATGAGGVVFRCIGGVPVPREGPWSSDGCPGADDQPETTLLATPGDQWQPTTACLIEMPIVRAPAAVSAERRSGR